MKTRLNDKDKKKLEKTIDYLDKLKGELLDIRGGRFNPEECIICFNDDEDELVDIEMSQNNVQGTYERKICGNCWYTIQDGEDVMGEE